MGERQVFVAATIEDIKTEWLWYPYIPCGKVTMLHGEEGVGKTMLGIKLMAACTSRVKMDRFGEQLEKGRCLYLTKTDNLAEIVKPKLKDAGAKLEDILIINDKKPMTLADDSLKNIIQQNQIRLMIVDPLSAYIEEKDKLYTSPDQIFPIIHKLELMAEETGCAIVIIDESEGIYSEMSKKWRDTFENSISSYLCLSWEEDLSYEERVLYHETAFLSLEGDPITYELGTKGMRCS